MPLSHRHSHPHRDIIDTVGDILDGKQPRAETDEEDIDGPTAIINPSKTKNLGTEIAVATGEATMKATDNIAADKTLVAPTQSATDSSSSSSSSDDASSETNGMSSGVTAGIAFGVLGGILIIGLLIFLMVSRRNKSKIAAAERGDEKAMSGTAPPPPMKDTKPARLSLRPVTQFFPQLSGEKRNSREDGFSMGPTSAAGKPRTFDRPGTSQSNHSANPFGSQSTHPSNPFGNQAERTPSPQNRNNPPTPDRNTKPAAFGRQASMHEGRGRQYDLTLSEARGAPSPTGTEFSMSSVTPGSGPAAPSSGAAAIAAAGGPKNTSVHRVQLDFKPSLDDEMELKAGELVRLLHEYDDGWALCIRLDRSRQGVVPRTCLSTRPVKPRPPQGGGPRGPPVNPQGASRGPFPPGPGQNRSESPARPRTATGPRPSSPASFHSQTPGSRPMSPANRSQSPGPTGRPRAPSKSHGPSPMNPSARNAPSPAPLPGMAM